MGAVGGQSAPTARGPRMDSDQIRRYHGARAELLLAIPPTLIVLGAVLAIEMLQHQRVLFASLASSAFLIYRDPGHQMNSVRTMVSAHLVAVVIGVGAGLLLGPGYIAAAIAMSGTITALILLDVVHPPAVSTALGFAFAGRQEPLVGLFLVALALVAALVLMQRIAVWALRRLSARVSVEREDDR